MNGTASTTFTWIQLLLTALGSGAVTALLPPLVKWDIEKRRDRRDAKKQMLEYMSGWVDANIDHLRELSGWLHFDGQCPMFDKFKPFMKRKLRKQIDALDVEDLTRKAVEDQSDGSAIVDLTNADKYPLVVLRKEISRLSHKWKFI